MSLVYTNEETEIYELFVKYYSISSRLYSNYEGDEKVTQIDYMWETYARKFFISECEKLKKSENTLNIEEMFNIILEIWLSSDDEDDDYEIIEENN